MYESGAERPVETILRKMEGVKKKDRRDESNTSCKNFYKCHNVPLVQL
jgi:hypothetical protein